VTAPFAPGVRSRGLLAALLLAGALACAAFAALGGWQLRRLAWKEDLIARVESHLRAAPATAPAPAAWSALGRGDEYRRVRLRGRYEHEHETAVRAVTALGGGYWILTPMLCEGGFRVLVNRGFVPAELRPRATRAAQEPAGVQQLTGLLRFSEPGGSLLQRNDSSAERWVSRDVPAIAAARGLEHAVPSAPVAPYFVDAEAGSATPATWPRAGLTVVRFSNNHLVYAVTWSALALMTAGAMAYLVVDARRRAAGERPLAHDRD
jgi:surfeit locus 1 family protein